MKMTYFSLLIACAVGAFSLFQSEKYQDSNQSLHRQLIRLEDDLKSKIEDLETQFRLLKEHNKNTAPPLNTLQWRRFEIESLLTLAHTQYPSTNQLGSVLTLMTNAEEKLNTLADPQLKPLEVALHQDITTLSGIRLIDQQARCQELDSLAQQIATLSFQTRSLSNEAVSDPAATEQAVAPVPLISTSDARSWRTVWSDSLQHLKDLVKIQRHIKPIEPLLTNAEQGLVQQQMRFLLEQTRLAILMSNQALYDQTLKAVLENLDHYYHLENVVPIKESLLSFSRQSIVNDLPTLNYVNQLSLLRPKP